MLDKCLFFSYKHGKSFIIIIIFFIKKIIQQYKAPQKNPKMTDIDLL